MRSTFLTWLLTFGLVALAWTITRAIGWHPLALFGAAVFIGFCFCATTTRESTHFLSACVGGFLVTSGHPFAVIAGVYLGLLSLAVPFAEGDELRQRSRTQLVGLFVGVLTAFGGSYALARTGSGFVTGAASMLTLLFATNWLFMPMIAQMFSEDTEKSQTPP